MPYRPTDTTPTEGLITASQVRQLAGGICQMTLSRWVKAGVLPPPLFIRRRRYWPPAKITAALAGRGEAA